MNMYQKLNEIFSVENINIYMTQDIDWLSIEKILRNYRLDKYYFWLTTGKVFPEAGQISPALAHNGRMKIMSQ